MTERPILFAAPMVRAILDGSKSQTRRLVTRANSYLDGSPASRDRWSELDFTAPEIFVDEGPSPAGNPGPYLHVPAPADGTRHRIYPRMQPGDRFWVREAWRVVEDGGTPDPINDTDCTIEYIADGAKQSFNTGKVLYPAQLRARPSIHMPRWASRILLDVLEVRVERLQALSAEDCQAEGVGNWSYFGGYDFDYRAMPAAIANFRRLWEGLNGPESWAANPWVWAISFKRAQQ
jgi:hypothetical protein